MRAITPRAGRLAVLATCAFVASSAALAQGSPCPTRTGEDATVVVPASAAALPLTDGDRLRVYGASGPCVGEGVWSGGGAAVAVWGDDAATGAVDGASAGEALTLWAVRGAEEVALSASLSGVLSAPGGTGLAYHPHAIYLVEELAEQNPTSEEDLPGGFRIGDPHPNPFTASAALTLELARTQRVTVAVYDVLGRAVRRLHTGILEHGREHRFTVEASGLASGAYLLRIEGEDFAEIRRLTLLR